jgi:hypothetical protein
MRGPVSFQTDELASEDGELGVYVFARGLRHNFDPLIGPAPRAWRLETDSEQRRGALCLLDLRAFRQEFRLPVVGCGVLREDVPHETIHVMTDSRRWHLDV